MNTMDLERRRTIRIRRSALARSDLLGLDRPAIKFADTFPEFEQAFSMVYDEYRQSGYIPAPKPSGMVLNPHNFLPNTVVFIAKSYEEVISTLAQFFDNPVFGLPMDAIYREELEPLRRHGRKISEIGTLATKKNFRWQNLFMYICQVMYWYSNYKKVDDLCITVNPKHAEFYKTIFLFEEFGAAKEHPKVGAPAVLLRLNMHNIREKLKEIYHEFDFESNLYRYFHQVDSEHLEDFSEALQKKGVMPLARSSFDPQTATYFFDKDRNVFDELFPEQKEYLKRLYPDMEL